MEYTLICYFFYLKKESFPRFTFPADYGVSLYPHHIDMDWSDLNCVRGEGGIVYAHLGFFGQSLIVPPRGNILCVSFKSLFETIFQYWIWLGLEIGAFMYPLCSNLLVWMCVGNQFRLVLGVPCPYFRDSLCRTYDLHIHILNTVVI